MSSRLASVLGSLPQGGSGGAAGAAAAGGAAGGAAGAAGALGLAGGGGGGGGGGGPQEQLNRLQQQQQNQQRASEERERAQQRRENALAALLTGAARERLSRIALVKPEKARGVEEIILRAAQAGQISECVDEKKLIQLLEEISESEKPAAPKIMIQRKRSTFDDEDDDFDEDDW